MATSKHFAASSFAVEMDSITVATFSEVSGLQSELETFTWEEGGNNEFVHVLPVRTKWSNITLKRGVADHALWQWYFDCVQGTVQRRGMSITLYSFSAKGQSFESLRWNIKNAFPIKWVGPSIRAGSAEMAFESIELSHQGFAQISGGA